MQKKSLRQARVHFIGIGGVGMSGLAELLANMGAKVSGSDLVSSSYTQRLAQLGVRIFKGHAAEHVQDVDVVVYSSAVTTLNPEFVEARRQKIPLIPRAEALAEMMSLKRGIAIAGSHGKTTTTSLTASIFLTAQVDPTIVVGGRLDVIKSTAWLGKGDWLIAEADESDGSFSKLLPEIAVITNIDDDHLDHYGSFDSLKKAFFGFASRIPFFGALVACGDDPVVRELFAEFNKKVIFYGFGSQNEFRLHGSNGIYNIYHDDQPIAEINVPMPGRHNALNALAAFVCARLAEIDVRQCQLGIEKFRGVDRRFQHKASVGGIEFYDDYGHHPSEIKAVLAAAKEKYPTKRLVVIFQPHRYSRTELCWQAFLNCFEDADILFMLDIYPAGESPRPSITAEKLAKEILRPSCQYLSPFSVADIRGQLKTGDVVLSLGAGSVSQLCEKLYQGNM